MVGLTQNSDVEADNPTEKEDWTKSKKQQTKKVQDEVKQQPVSAPQHTPKASEDLKQQTVKNDQQEKLVAQTFSPEQENEDQNIIDPVKSEAAETASNYPMYLYEGYEGYEEDVGEGYYNPRYNERTGEEFPCHLCGKLYKTSGSLKNHRSLYHRDQTSKYQCHKNKQTLPQYNT